MSPDETSNFLIVTYLVFTVWSVIKYYELSSYKIKIDQVINLYNALASDINNHFVNHHEIDMLFDGLGIKRKIIDAHPKFSFWTRENKIILLYEILLHATFIPMIIWKYLKNSSLCILFSGIILLIFFILTPIANSFSADTLNVSSHRVYILCELVKRNHILMSRKYDFTEIDNQKFSYLNNITHCKLLEMIYNTN